MARALAVLALVGGGGCGAPAPVVTPAPVTTTPSPPPASALPVGWVAVEPTEEASQCSRLSDHAWQVAPASGSVAITEVSQRPTSSGPALPFELPRDLGPRHSRRHVLAVDGGFLVGLDAGEWGGSLHTFAADGTQHSPLGKDNVHGLVAFGADVVSIEGITHMTLSSGSLRWLRHDSGAWRQVALEPLDSGPQTFVATSDALYVVTLRSLVRVGRDHTVTTIQPLEIHGIDLDSMVVDAAGQLWLGMRHFVLRLTPHGDRFEETWLVREGCQRTSIDEARSECICGG